MFVNSCRRCAASEIPTNEVRTIECAGEVIRLCNRCHEELREWFSGVAEAAPELELVSASR